MNMTAKVAGVLCIVLVSLAAGGCATRQSPGAAGVTQLAGTAESIVDAAPQRVLEVAETVFAELNITPRPVVTGQLPEEVILRGRAEDGRNVRVSVRQVGPTASRVHVRVGALGDRELSTTLLQRIRALL